MDESDFCVEAYAGYKGEETPRSFSIDGVRHVVDEIVARWYTETHSYFRIQTTTGRRYVLRYFFDDSKWELVMWEENR